VDKTGAMPEVVDWQITEWVASLQVVWPMSGPHEQLAARVFWEKRETKTRRKAMENRIDKIFFIKNKTLYT